MGFAPESCAAGGEADGVESLGTLTKAEVAALIEIAVAQCTEKSIDLICT